MRELKIGTAWVRGVVGEGLTPELVVRFAAAFGTWTEAGPVMIGRDTRRSSSMFRSAALAGLLASGCEVVDLGVSSTPLLSFSVRELGASGGIMISGSHNDSRWNALKFFGPDGALLDGVRSEELFDIYHALAFRPAPPDQPNRITRAPYVIDRYLESLYAGLDIDSIRKRGFRVVMDFCHGATAAIASRFLKGLGCVLMPLHPEPTGEFPHPPAPSLENMREVAEAVISGGADLGTALNVDGDRIGFVTAGGIALSEEFTLPLAATGRLRRRSGPIVTNYSTSRMIDFVVKQHGASVVRTSVGESPVMNKGLEEGAVLAGEGSGGVGILPATMTFDGLLTLGIVLEATADMDAGIADIIRTLPRLTMRKGQVPCEPAQSYRILERFRSAYSDLSPDCTDGIWVDQGTAWLHVRASNTEPLLRVIVESDRKERADSFFEEAMAFAREASAQPGGQDRHA